MRRALLTWLPALSHTYGLKPWDLDQLTFRELQQYIAKLRTFQQSVNQPDQPRGRRR